MTVHKQAIGLAGKLGAKLDVPEYSAHDRSYTVQAVAPDGKQWVAAGSLHLVCVWFTYVKGDKDIELQDLINRMNEGIEDLDTELNP